MVLPNKENIEAGIELYRARLQVLTEAIEEPQDDDYDFEIAFFNMETELIDIEECLRILLHLQSQEE